MRGKIIQTLQSDLIEEVGANSSYDSLRVEEIKERLPDIIGTNIFIGLDVETNSPITNEIGSHIPVTYEYDVIIALLIKNADIQKGQQNLDTISRRILKFLYNGAGDLNGQTVTEDGITETVSGFNLETINYTSGELKQSEVGHIAVFNLTVKSEININ